MLIALISDIHGNLPALEEILAEVGKAGAEEIWFLGDFAGYVPFPNDVLDIVRNQQTLSVIGNYDQKVLKFHKKRAKWKKTKKSWKYDAFKWNALALSKKNRRYLESLPDEIRFELEGYRILLTHGSPESINEPLGPETDAQRLAELAEVAEADIVVAGHSHSYLNKTVKRCRFINPGSAGMPSDEDMAATYAFLKIDNGRISVEKRRLKLDVPRILRAMHAAGFSRKLQDYFI